MEKLRNKRPLDKIVAFGRTVLNHLPPPLVPDFVLNDLDSLNTTMLDKHARSKHVVIFDGSALYYNADGTLHEKTRTLIEDLAKAHTIVVNADVRDSKSSEHIHTELNEIVGPTGVILTAHDSDIGGNMKPVAAKQRMLDDTHAALDASEM